MSKEEKAQHMKVVKRDNEKIRKGYGRDDEFQEGERSEIDIGNDRRKRKSESQVPKLIDNKRKHMQKTLSAAQRDQVLLNETKEDNQLRKDLAAAMRESTDSFAKAFNGMSNSVVQIGAGICKSLEVMAHAMMTPTNQNMFYQNQPLQRFPYQDPYVGSGQRAFQQPSPLNGQN
eukprot:gene2553-2948_t